MGFHASRETASSYRSRQVGWVPRNPQSKIVVDTGLETRCRLERKEEDLMAWSQPMDVAVRALVAGLCITCGLGACEPQEVQPLGELVFSYQAPTWFEDGWGFYDVSADGREAIYGARFGRMVFDLERGTEVQNKQTVGRTGGRDRRFLRLAGPSLAPGRA